MRIVSCGECSIKTDISVNRRFIQKVILYINYLFVNLKFKTISESLTFLKTAFFAAHTVDNIPLEFSRYSGTPQVIDWARHEPFDMKNESVIEKYHNRAGCHIVRSSNV